MYAEKFNREYEHNRDVAKKHLAKANEAMSVGLALTAAQETEKAHNAFDRMRTALDFWENG